MSGHNPADHWIGVWVLAIICMVGNSCMSGSCGNRDFIEEGCHERAITTWRDDPKCDHPQHTLLVRGGIPVCVCLPVGPPEPPPPAPTDTSIDL